jgi:hypothetical protein
MDKNCVFSPLVYIVLCGSGGEGSMLQNIYKQTPKSGKLEAVGHKGL